MIAATTATRRLISASPMARPFGRSNQARYGSSNYSNTLRSSSQSSSVASATSRGGFGSKASARSGWGGGGFEQLRTAGHEEDPLCRAS